MRHDCFAREERNPPAYLFEGKAPATRKTSAEAEVQPICEGEAGKRKKGLPLGGERVDLRVYTIKEEEGW